MWKKKGEAEASFLSVRTVAFIFAAIVALVMLGIFIKFLTASDFAKKCGNAADFQAVVKAVQSLEAGKQVADVFFSNSDCMLVSFNDQQYQNTLATSRSPQTVGGPRLCLCRMEGSQCEVYKQCYKFTNIEKINARQFSSQDLGKNIFLRFKVAEKVLTIEKIENKV